MWSVVCGEDDSLHGVFTLLSRLWWYCRSWVRKTVGSPILATLCPCFKDKESSTTRENSIINYQHVNKKKYIKEKVLNQYTKDIQVARFAALEGIGKERSPLGVFCSGTRLRARRAEKRRLFGLARSLVPETPFLWGGERSCLRISPVPRPARRRGFLFVPPMFCGAKRAPYQPETSMGSRSGRRRFEAVRACATLL